MSSVAGLLLILGLLGCGDDGSPGDAGGGTDADATSDDGAACACRSDDDCSDTLFCNGAERCLACRCEPGIPPSCNDGIACTADRCSEEEATCRSAGPDADDDGHLDGACGGDDCNDSDPEVYPGATELCDAADRD